LANQCVIAKPRHHQMMDISLMTEKW